MKLCKDLGTQATNVKDRPEVSGLAGVFYRGLRAVIKNILRFEASFFNRVKLIGHVQSCVRPENQLNRSVWADSPHDFNGLCAKRYIREIPVSPPADQQP